MFDNLFLIKVFVIVTLSSIILGDVKNQADLIILKNEKIEVGILPEVGGRIVLLRIPGYENILKSDSSLWESPEEHKPEISPQSEFKAFNGHITWVGPQKEWWIHQSLNEHKKKAKTNWPPDPYLIYGKNEIISKTDTSVSMAGLPSPISGGRIYKDISITSKGVVTVTSTAENIRDENVAWDLWMPTRLDGFAKTYVPIDENGILELVMHGSEFLETTPYKIIENFITLNPSIPAQPKKEQIQKFHLYPSSNYLAGFDKGQMLLIKFNKLGKELVHPDHGLVELYSYVNKYASNSLLELEVHGKHETILPGEKISLTEQWELIAYDGDNNCSAQISFLKNHVIKGLKQNKK